MSRKKVSLGSLPVSRSSPALPLQSVSSAAGSRFSAVPRPTAKIFEFAAISPETSERYLGAVSTPSVNTIIAISS